MTIQEIELHISQIKEEIEKGYSGSTDRESVLLNAFSRWLNKL
jgi:hypothetical protein